MHKYLCIVPTYDSRRALLFCLDFVYDLCIVSFDFDSCLAHFDLFAVWILTPAFLTILILAQPL